MNVTLKQGNSFGRYGNIGDKSNFVTQTGADANKLSLPPNTDPAIYQEFTVLKEIPNTTQAKIRAWGMSNSGGQQFDTMVNRLPQSSFINKRLIGEK